MNKLTERLFAEGYTKENHPDYVEWSNWKDFEYTRSYLARSVWETPCGLLQKGIDSYNHMSYAGIDYCPENNNPIFGCPYYDETPCQHRMDNKLWGCNCTYHQTDRQYDYDNSAEKIWDAWDKTQSKAWQAATAEYGFCACMEWDRPNRRYKSKHDIDKCVQAHCGNEVCAITKKQRNLEKVNIYYDILRVWRYKKGFIETTNTKIQKGVKKFESPIARTDAEIWLKANRGDFEPKHTSQDRKELFFTKYHGKTGFDDYEWFELVLTPQNIRIEKRESRDLLQDLRDVSEGIEVTHASDELKAKKEAKREYRKQCKEAKAKRVKKRKIAALKQMISDADSDDTMKHFAERELSRCGIAVEKDYEQLTLF